MQKEKERRDLYSDGAVAVIVIAEEPQSASVSANRGQWALVRVGADRMHKRHRDAR